MRYRDDDTQISRIGITPCFEEGNGKTGKKGKKLNRVLVWNLPPIEACPARSRWCYENCYNADPREEVYPIRKWRENLHWAKDDPDSLFESLSAQLKKCDVGQIGVRLHSSGDFFSSRYIEMWHYIASQFPNVLFWAYTRSWAVRSLWNPLFELSCLNNFSLLCSWDSTMKNPPDDMPLSIVVPSMEDLAQFTNNANAWVCPEQFGLIPGCADCGFCFNKPHKNVIFLEH